MLSIYDKSGRKEERCFTDFPDDCVACEFYKRKMTVSSSLMYLLPFFVSYDNLPKTIEVCTKYNKKKISM